MQTSRAPEIPALPKKSPVVSKVKKSPVRKPPAVKRTTKPKRNVAPTNKTTKPKQPKRLGRQYKSQYQKTNIGIVNVPIKKNLHTKGGEYTLKGKDYKGYYHVHTDMGYAMTGKTHSKASKYLEKDGDQIVGQQQRTTSQTTRRTPRSEGRY